MAPNAAHMVALISLSAVSSARASSSVLALRHDGGAGVFCMLQQAPISPGGAWVPEESLCAKAVGPDASRVRAGVRARFLGLCLRLPVSRFVACPPLTGTPEPPILVPCARNIPQPCAAEWDARSLEPPALSACVCFALPERSRPQWTHPLGLVSPQVSPKANDPRRAPRDADPRALCLPDPAIPGAEQS